MQSVDNSQFSEEQRAEAYRVESMRQLVRQTKALETLRSIAIVFLILVGIGAVMATISLASLGQP